MRHFQIGVAVILLGLLSACGGSTGISVMANPVTIRPPENLMTPARELTPILWTNPDGEPGEAPVANKPLTETPTKPK